MNNMIQTASTTVPTINIQPSSIFSDFDLFNQSLQMATILSKTQLIPQNFQGKPEDCLIALDFARRLGVSPTSVLPELYIIHGRPAISAKFMISLVNRSGVFSRIQWKEDIDGEVEYLVNGSKRTIPNYSAVAYFTELSSGETYESPKIDMRFALSNGWLTKNDSQWQKMPQVMARYRSASILIKTTCPELAMGMESLEEARDFEEDERPSRRTVQTLEVASVEKANEPEADAEDQEKIFNEFATRIADADGQELRAIGADICYSNLDEQHKEKLRVVFKNRRIALAQAAVGEENDKREENGDNKAVGNSKPSKRTTKKKTTEKDAIPEEPEYKRLERAFVEEIKNAQDEQTLVEVLDKINQAMTDAKLYSDQYGGLRDLFDIRMDEVKEARIASFSKDLSDVNREINSANATAEQKRWAAQLVETIFAAESGEFVKENLIPTAKEWLEKGYLTSELHQSVVDAATIRINSENEGK